MKNDPLKGIYYNFYHKITIIIENILLLFPIRAYTSGARRGNQVRATHTRPPPPALLLESGFFYD